MALELARKDQISASSESRVTRSWAMLQFGDQPKVGLIPLVMANVSVSSQRPSSGASDPQASAAASSSAVAATRDPLLIGASSISGDGATVLDPYSSRR